MSLRWFRALSCAVGFCLSPLGAQVVAYTHATLIDGSDAAPVSDSTLVVEHGRILDLGPASKVKIPAGASVSDESGHTIIPGIIDLHVHADADTAVKLRQFALYGVTSVLSMGSDSDALLALRNAQRGNESEIHGARVYTVNQRFEFEKDAPNVATARAKVDALAAKRVDAVKIVVDSRHNTQVKLSREIQLAIIDEAHKKHLKVFAHMYELADAKFLLEHGIDLLAHNVRDTDIDEQFINDMKKRGIAMTPTLTGSLSYFVYAESPAWLHDPFFLKFADPQRVRQAATEFPVKQKGDPVAAQNMADYKMDSKNLRRLVAAGVKVAFGNDDGNNPTRFEGFFEHLEMELMVRDAGMTPMQVITAFSKTNSEALGIDKDYGTLAKGKVADFLVLDQSPEKDILNTRTLRTVYIGGRIFE